MKERALTIAALILEAGKAWKERGITIDFHIHNRGEELWCITIDDINTKEHRFYDNNCAYGTSLNGFIHDPGFYKAEAYIKWLLEERKETT